jgi:hypothetical protein
MTVELVRERVRPYQWRNERSHYAILTRCLPFFRSKPDTYVHRVRSGRVHFWDGKVSHTSLSMWCGQSGYVGDRGAGEIFADAPIKSTVCATCEGRAIGAGQLGAKMLCGRVVKFSPQR